MYCFNNHADLNSICTLPLSLIHYLFLCQGTKLVRWIQKGLYVKEKGVTMETRARAPQRQFTVFYFILWLVPRVDKMRQILRYDWQKPSEQDGATLPAQDYPPCPAKKFPESHFDRACSRKKNLTNIQPS